LKKHPQRNVRFYQKVGIGKRNPMMQVLEVPENFRITDEYLDAFKTLRLNRDFEQPTLFQRMNKALFG
jgi:hypothetical protein